MAVEITRMDVSAAEPRLTAEQEAELARWVRTGPDVERDGVGRWRLVDLLERVAREFGVSFHDRNIGKLLCRLGLRHLSVRSRHPEADPEAQETHKKSSRRWSAAAVPNAARERPIELWWQDEARVGQQGSPTHVWAEHGSRPRMLRDRVMIGPTSSARCVQPAASALVWSCRRSIPTS